MGRGRNNYISEASAVCVRIYVDVEGALLNLYNHAGLSINHKTGIDPMTGFRG
jgi:hypothetical protein